MKKLTLHLRIFLNFRKALDDLNIIHVDTKEAFCTWTRIGACSFVERKLEKVLCIESCLHC